MRKVLSYLGIIAISGYLTGCVNQVPLNSSYSSKPKMSYHKPNSSQVAYSNNDLVFKQESPIIEKLSELSDMLNTGLRDAKDGANLKIEGIAGDVSGVIPGSPTVGRLKMDKELDDETRVKLRAPKYGIQWRYPW